MELIDLKNSIASLQAKCKMDCRALEKQYALERAKFKIGDVITDHTGSILVERIDVEYMGQIQNEPKCVYFGVELKKDLTPTKKGDKRYVWESNIK